MQNPQETVENLQETVESILEAASAQAQETLIAALSRYNTLSQQEGLELGDLERIVTGTNNALSRLKIETVGYDRQLPPRVEQERITGMDVPLIRLNDQGLWDKI